MGFKHHIALIQMKKIQDMTLNGNNFDTEFQDWEFDTHSI